MTNKTPGTLSEAPKDLCYGTDALDHLDETRKRLATLRELCNRLGPVAMGGLRGIEGPPREGLQDPAPAYFVAVEDRIIAINEDIDYLEDLISRVSIV